MKYKVLKEMPYNKAGDIIEIGLDHDQAGMGFYSHKTILCGNKSYLEELLSNGWIEEVKPREFWCNVYNNRYGALHTSRKSADEAGEDTRTDIIRVQVID